MVWIGSTVRLKSGGRRGTVSAAWSGSSRLSRLERIRRSKWLKRAFRASFRRPRPVGSRRTKRFRPHPPAKSAMETSIRFGFGTFGQDVRADKANSACIAPASRAPDAFAVKRKTPRTRSGRNRRIRSISARTTVRIVSGYRNHSHEGEAPHSSHATADRNGCACFHELLSKQFPCGFRTCRRAIFEPRLYYQRILVLETTTLISTRNWCNSIGILCVAAYNFDEERNDTDGP